MSGKHTAMSIAHELCREYNIGCVVCGDTDIEMHHYPSIGKMGKRRLSEILFVTIFPLCQKCHTEFHIQGEHKHELKSCIRIIKKSNIMREHINRIVARNVNTLE
jgi:hypothetical protein